jgi:hypothetical protein
LIPFERVTSYHRAIIRPNHHDAVVFFVVKHNAVVVTFIIFTNKATIEIVKQFFGKLLIFVFVFYTGYIFKIFLVFFQWLSRFASSYHCDERKAFIFDDHPLVVSLAYSAQRSAPSCLIFVFVFTGTFFKSGYSIVLSSTPLTASMRSRIGAIAVVLSKSNLSQFIIPQINVILRECRFRQVHLRQNNMVMTYF